MKTLLAVILGVLALLGALGFGAWELWHVSAAQTSMQADLASAKSANESQALALATLTADREADRKQVAALGLTLAALDSQHKRKRNAFAQVVANAKPADRDLLTSKLPAAALQLLPHGGTTADADASNPAVDP